MPFPELLWHILRRLPCTTGSINSVEVTVTVTRLIDIMCNRNKAALTIVKTIRAWSSSSAKVELFFAAIDSSN